MAQQQEASLQTLQDIRRIMEQSTRFISLSGWSGVWAGGTAIVGGMVANSWLQSNAHTRGQYVLLAICVLLVAFAGAYYFTWRKARQQGAPVWNAASRRMVAEIAVPMLAGGVFALYFLYTGHELFIAPVCLAFYGLALINGSKYTLSDIKYLGLCIVLLGCVNLFMPSYGLWFWAAGFGVLHVLYGIVMWKKYDN